MILLDKIYINIYWVVNKRLNPQKITIWALNYLFFPALSGFLVFIISLLFWLISIQLNLKVLIFIGIVISFFLSEKLIEMYYTDKTQKRIVENNSKPSIFRYFTFLLIAIFSVLVSIITTFIALSYSSKLIGVSFLTLFPIRKLIIISLHSLFSILPIFIILKFLIPLNSLVYEILIAIICYLFFLYITAKLFRIDYKSVFLPLLISTKI